MTEKDFLPTAYPENRPTGKTAWKAPSNIALVKYWGKRAGQLPANPSLSFTLRECTTTTSLAFGERQDISGDYSFDLLFEGKPRTDFKPKIDTFFQRVEAYLPFLKDYHFTIETSNTFPHSSGIASSASGMAALALCLLEIERALHPDMEGVFFTKKASFLARLGSGSACRSIEGGLIAWGEHDAIPGSSNLYGIPFPHPRHEVFDSYQDVILLVDQGKKQVSSSVGHDLMHGHPYALNRFEQAKDNLSRLRQVFATGNLEEFMAIVESEALSLHAMMMTSRPYYMLLKPNTLAILESIWRYRDRTKVPVCFTLDAGANVHLLFPASQKQSVDAFIRDELVAYCEKGQYLCDQVGNGAKKM